MRSLTPPRLLALAALPLLAVACDSTTGPEDAQDVTIRFAATSETSASAPGLASLVEGSNGSVEITDLRMIVGELQFEGDDDGCDDDDDRGCEEVDLPPFLASVPVDGAPLTVTTTELPVGVYDEFELDVEDLEDDADDAEFGAAIAALRSQIAQEFGDWPEEATVRVEGTFTETGGAPEAFVVYIEAEVEVELDLVPPLDVSAAGGAASVDVMLMPERWFVRGNGEVLDLREWDYETTGRLLELEVEIEDGIEVEVDDD